MYAVQCRDISAVSVRQIPVGRRDTGNMGAVLALCVRLMRYVQILVDVAIAVCDLFCPVQIRRTDAFLDMQQAQLFVDLVRIEQIERGLIGFDGFLCARAFCSSAYSYAPLSNDWCDVSKPVSIMAIRIPAPV